jgi:outer membrane protein OmpA-like peptidoglycan-associated protein
MSVIPPVSQVARLKELLFDKENEAIAVLSRRIDDVFDRAGTDDRFRTSVAHVLDGALREAEVDNHAQLAGAIAPLIVKTVKTEIRNSQDEIVEAIYPATGRMVKAYMASAIKDLTDQINRRFEANPVMLRLQALTSGRSVGELAIAGSQKLSVDDVFLIRRATGELVGRWPQSAAGANRDHVMSGVLTAINEFTTEAFKAEGSALRQLDLGDARVYLRVSPTYLLAAKCTGSAPLAAEQIIDDEFLSVIDRQHNLEDGHNGNLNGMTNGAATASLDATPLLRDLSGRLETRISQIQEAARQGGIKPVTLLLITILLPLFALLSWNAYVDVRLAQVRGIAERVRDANADMRGFPAEFKVEDRGRTLTLTGLAPSDAARQMLIGQLRAVLPAVEIRDQLGTVATSPDSRPLVAVRQDMDRLAADIQSAALKRAFDRARAGLATVQANLATAASAATGGDDQQRLAAFLTRTNAIGTHLATASSPSEALESGLSLRTLADDMALLLAAGTDITRPVATEATAEAEQLQEAVNRLGLAAAGLAQSEALKRQMRAQADQLRIELAPAPPGRPNPRVLLEQFTRANAIFFANSTELRDKTAADRVLDGLVPLLAADPALLRVIGYTDDAGTPAANTALSKARADAIAAELKARGVWAGRIVTLGRTASEYRLSTGTGTGNSNRRVEFELGFIGEVAE